MSSHEWATIFVIRHESGSEEGAVFQRNEMDKALRELGGEVVMANTKPGDAAMTGWRVFNEDDA